MSPENLHYLELTLAVGAGAKAEAEATRAREQAAANFIVEILDEEIVVRKCGDSTNHT